MQMTCWGKYFLAFVSASSGPSQPWGEARLFFEDSFIGDWFIGMFHVKHSYKDRGMFHVKQFRRENEVKFVVSLK